MNLPFVLFWSPLEPLVGTEAKIPDELMGESVMNIQSVNTCTALLHAVPREPYLHFVPLFVLVETISKYTKKNPTTEIYGKASLNH